jgi:L-iditol 2-dehydrogenase
MKAVVIEKPHHLELRDIPMPRPLQDEVLVKVAACGICGSDLRYLHGDNPWARQTLGAVKENPHNMPVGHEFAGTIAGVGSESLRDRIGRRVAVLAYRGCGSCRHCRLGQHNLCGEVKHIGHSAGWEGEEFNPAGMGEYCRVWNEMARDLPESISFERATLLDALAVAIHACRRGNIEKGDSVLIIGTGAVGLLILQVALISGASHVACRDAHPAPLSVARELGADACRLVPETVPLTGEPSPGEPSFDAVFDSVGTGETVSAGLRSLRRGGRLVALALAADAYRIPPALLSGERSITTSANNGYPEFQGAIDLMASGRIQADPLITHRFPLLKAKRAFQVAEEKEEHGAIKVILLP